jgi:hypothetical protein
MSKFLASFIQYFIRNDAKKFLDISIKIGWLRNVSVFDHHYNVLKRGDGDREVSLTDEPTSRRHRIEHVLNLFQHFRNGVGQCIIWALKTPTNPSFVPAAGQVRLTIIYLTLLLTV